MMDEDKLSNIENNLALIVGLTQVQIKVQESLVDQCEKLTEVSEDFREMAETCRQSVIGFKDVSELQIATLGPKIKLFLEGHQLFTMWEKK